MSQVTIYVDDDAEHRIRDAASAAGVSISRWIADLVRTRTSASWPPEVARLAGSWGAAEPELRAQDGEDVPREPL